MKAEGKPSRGVGHNVSPEAFYDVLAPYYEQTRDLTRQYILEKPFFRVFRERYRIHSALDMGAGTGFHSFMLARMGVSVTAVDISSNMLLQLDARARSEALPIRCIQSTFLDVPSKCNEAFDSVFCMGDALLHHGSQSELHSVLRTFYQLLNAGGVLMIELTNFDRIFPSLPKSINRTDYECATLTHEFDRSTNRIILELNIDDGTGELGKRRTVEVHLRPVNANGLMRPLERIGFSAAEAYGSISMELFEPTTSKKLYVVARRRQ